MDRGAWQATVHRVARVRLALATKPLSCSAVTSVRCPEGRGPYLVVVVAGQQDEQRQRQGDVRSLGDVLLGQLPL